MRYNSYEQRVDKMVKAKKFVLRHLVLIVCLSILAVATVVCLCSIKGTVIEGDAPLSFEYGQDFEYEASAVFNSVTYQFKAEGSDEWTSVVPKEVGTYSVRAVSNGLFGDVRYGEVKTFTISPKSLDVTIKEDSVTYGENPTLQADLAKGDVIECSEFDFADFTKETTTVKPDSESLVIRNSDGKDVTSSYEINIVEKSIKFTKRAIEIVISGDEKVYFAGNLTIHAFEVNEEKGTLAYGDNVSMDFSKSIIDVGEIENTPENFRITNTQGQIVTDRYEVTKVVGTLKITKRHLIIYPSGASKVYDGTPLSCAAYDQNRIEGDGLAGKDYISQVTALNSITTVAESESENTEVNHNQIDIRISDPNRKDADGKDLDVTHDYNIIYYRDDSKLTITPRPITVTSEGANKVYDGTPLESTNFDCTEASQSNPNEGLLSIHDIFPVSNASIQNYVDGGIENTIEVCIKEGDEDVTANYAITYDFGTLTILKRPITITAGSADKTYDGTALSCNSFTYTLPSDEVGTGLVCGRITLTIAGLQTLAGESTNAVVDGSVLIYDDNDVDVTDNYDITTQVGTLTVTQRPIKIQPTHKTKIYDATPLVSRDVDVLVEDGFMALVDGESIVCKQMGSIATAGSETVSLTADDVTNGDFKIYSGEFDVTDSYAITFVDGVYEIEKRPIAVKPVDKTKVYDAEVLTSDELQVLDKDGFYALVDGHKLSCDTMGAIVNVESETVYASSVRVFDATGNEVTPNYAIDSNTSGTFTITPRPITVTSEGARKVYDDVDLSNDNFTYTQQSENEGLLTDKGHNIAAVEFATLRDVGEIENRIIVRITKGDEPLTQNYDITYVYGRLEVTPRPITLTANSQTRMYDGTALYDDGFSVEEFDIESNRGRIEGHEINATVKGSITNVGDVSNIIVKESVVITSGERDVTRNYDISLADGTLTVIHRPIVVVSLSQTFVYNGKDQSYEEFDVTEGEGITDGKGSIINGQISKVVNNTTIQNVNESGKDNVLEISIFDGDTDVTDNYTIDYQSYGKLTVTKRPITVTANSQTRMYDGTPLVDGGVSADPFNEENGTGIVDGHVVTATVKGSITDVGSEANIIIEGSVVVKNGDEEVTPNYEITTQVGTLTVTVRPIRVQTATASFVYDGKEHYCDDFEVVSEIKVADNQTASVTAKPSVQNVWDGTIENKLTVVIYDKDGKDVSKNYEITYEYGDINVTPRQIKITAGSAEKVYDDEPLSCSDYYVESTDGDRGLAPSQRAEASVVKLSVITYTPTPQPNRIDPASVVIYDQNGQSTIGEHSVKENYEVEFVDGELIVNKRPITVTGVSDEKIYDATGLFNNEFTYTKYGKDEGLLENREHKISKYKFATLTDAGEIENVITVNITVVRQNGYEENVTENYKITYVYGTLKVTPRPITVKTKTMSFVYNGKEQFCEEFNVTEGEGIKGQNPIANGQEARVASNTKIQNVKESGKDNVLEIKIFDFEGNEINLKNYAITYEYGTLSVTPRPIAVKLTDRKKVYDALPFVTDQVEVISLENTMPIVDGHYVQIDSVGDGIVDADTYKVGFKTAYIFDANGNDVTDNYAITMVEGTLTILKRKVTVTAGSASKVYDGKALWCKDVTIEEQNGDRGILVGLHSASAKVNEFSVTDWSDTIRYNTIDEASFIVTAADGNDVTRNYEPQFINGELTIYKRHITITALGDEKVYDDAPLINKEYTVETALDDRGLLTDLGHKLCDMVTNGTITSKGSVQNTFANEAVITDADDKDITYNYQIEYVYENLVVTPRPITVTSKDATKIYDATELINKDDFDYTHFGENIGLINGHIIEAYTWAELTDAGSKKNEITVKITVVRENGDVDVVTGNYKIEYTYGTLTVTKRPITVVSESKEFEYNGKEQFWDGFKATNVVEGQKAVVETRTQIKNVAESGKDNKLTVKVLAADGKTDVTNNYTITYPSYGTLTVTKRAITLKPADGEKVYDGKAFTSTAVEIVNGSLAEGHAFDCNPMGTLVSVGSETISIDKENFRILDEKRLNATENYDITYQGTGTLTILKRKVTVTACSAEVVSDETTVLERKLFRCTEFDENKHVGLVPWHDITATVTGRQEGIGSSPNVVSDVRIYDKNTNEEVTDNYDITLKNGTLRIVNKDGDSSDNVVLDDGGDLRGNDGQSTDPKVVLSVKSGVSDRVYFKLKSYGDFTGKGWSDATAYNSTIDGTYGFDYLTGRALSGAGFTAYDIAIRSNISQYLLPYYMAMSEGNYNVQTSDVAYVGNGLTDYYSLQYYVAYAKQIITLKSSVEGSAEEQAHRAFVKEKYTTVPDDMKVYLQGIIGKQGFDADSLDVYEQVANYVKSAAKYNMKYDSNLDSATNIIYAFLNEYKEGVCRHFASAATLIFRQLGIPARYATGLTGRTQANEWTDITTNGSHAWVEVYVDGIGWVQLEVTPGGAGNGNGNEESDGNGERFDGSDLTPDQKILDITPITVSKIHDGTPLYAENEIIVTENIQRLLKLGYRYVVEVTGSQTDVGIGKSTITEFVLFDPNGANVTDNGTFTINLCEGDIVVYDKKIGIHLGELEKTYDGQPFDISQYMARLSATAENLPEGYTVDFEIEPLVDAGVYTAYGVTIKNYTVRDASGNIVTGILIEIVDGSITILKRNITVESKNYTKVYDGTPLRNEGDVTVERPNGNRGILNGHVLSAKTLAERTNAGSTPNAVTDIAIFDEKGNDVTNNYAVSTIVGTLTVTKRCVYITTADAEKFYDGTPLTKEQPYTVEPFDADKKSGFVLDHAFGVLQVIGSQTDAGQALNEINYNTISIKDGAGVDVTSNYQVICTPGTLNVLQRRITITTADSTKVYDGTPLTCGDYEISDDGQDGAGFAPGQKIGSVEIVGSRLDVGYSSNTVGKLTIVDANGNEVNRDNYIVTYHEGTLTVTARPIWVKSASASKVYDGTPLSAGYDYERFNESGSGLANGHEIEVIITSSLTDVWIIPNTIDDVIITDSNGNPVTANYVIHKIEGELEVTKRPIKITTASATKVYDGTPLVKKDGYTIENPNTANTRGLVSGHTYELNFTAKAINYGVVENAVSVTIFDASGNDVTHNYDYVSDLEFGLLEITQRPIWFMSGSASKVYDAIALKCGVFDYERFNASTDSGLLEGHNVFYKLASSITDAVSVNNAITEYSIRTDDGDDVTFNYEISLREGTLEVTPRPILIKSASDSKVYDGKVLSNGGYTYERFDKASERGLLTIHDIEVIITTTIINAGSVENSIDNILITDADGKSVIHNYRISIELGTLTVYPIELEIVTEGAEKFYDGTPLTNERYNHSFLNALGFVADHRLDGIRFTGSQTIAGSSENTIAEDEVRVLNGAGGDVTANYKISYRYGELIVNQRPIGINPDGASKVYDGTSLTNQTYKISDCGYGKDGGLAPKQYIARIRFIGEITEVGTDYVRLDVDYLAIYDQNGNDVTRNYVVSTEDGMLEVMPIELEIVTEGAEKVYDGTPLTNERYNYSFLNALGFVADHRLDGIRFTGSQTIAGSSPNTIAEDEVRVRDGAGNDVTENYRISYLYGELIVTPRPITIITDSASKVYDGAPLSKDKYTVEHSDGETTRGLLEGHTLTLSLKEEIINVGSTPNAVTDLRIVDADGNGVTDNYAPEYQCGTLEITPRPVWISSGTSERVYDGTPLKNGAVDIEPCNADNTGGLVSGHRYDVALNKSITDVGSIRNEFDYVIIKDADGNDVTYNYAIIPHEGTLTVYPIELMIVTEGAEKFYDGTPLTNDKYDITVLNATDFVAGHRIIVQVIGSQTIVGSSPNAIDESGVKVLDADGNDVTKNYRISYQYGELIVNQRHIGIYPDGAEKIYDGTPLTNQTYTISDCGYGKDGGLAPEQYVATVSFDGWIINVGTVPATLIFESLSICDKDGNDVTENYDVTSIPGALTVNPRKLQIVVDDASKEYDGTPLVPTPGGYTIIDDGSGNGGLAPGQNISEIELGGEQLKPGSSPATVVSIKITDGYGDDVTGNYDIEIVDGTLTVERLGGLDTSGGIGDGPGGGPGEISDNIQVVLRVKSETSGSIYLKIKSFGNYGGKGWSDAVEYGKTLMESFGFDYLTGSALKKAGVTEYGIEIKSETMQYFLPYYLSMTDGSYDIQSSDTEYFGDPLEPYSLKYYSAFVSQISTLAGVKDATAYTEQEAAYREFVYKNYLDVPAETEEYLQKLIEKNKKTFTTGNIYEAVASFIQNAAEYDLDYDRTMDEADDIVVAFLRDYKKGVCRHYASAATLLFRTLGIPARYSIGYVGQTSANEWVDITDQQGHAWVEVYIDGIGWAQVEVTGGGPGSGNGNGNGSGFDGSGGIGEGEFDDSDPKDVTINVKPARIGKAYDGTPLYARNEIERNDTLQKLLAKGYSYRVKVEGSQTDVGIGASRITDFKLLDPNGNDVTEGKGFIIVKHDGEIVIKEKHVRVFLYSNSKTYDGKPLSFEVGEMKLYHFVDVEGRPLQDDITIDFTLNPVVNAGVYKAEDIGLESYTVRDAKGNDVTANYYVDTTGGTSTIKKRAIDITAGSATKVYDGKELTNDSYDLSGKGLVEGNVLEVLIEGSITDVGSVANMVKGVRITDANGNNVSDNYQVTGKWGTLTVTKP